MPAMRLPAQMPSCRRGKRAAWNLQQPAECTLCDVLSVVLYICFTVNGSFSLYTKNASACAVQGLQKCPGSQQCSYPLQMSSHTLEKRALARSLSGSVCDVLMSKVHPALGWPDVLQFPSDIHGPPRHHGDVACPCTSDMPGRG